MDGDAGGGWKRRPNLGYRPGFEVIATCHPRNFDYAKSLGATAAFDYTSEACGADIRSYTSNTSSTSWTP
jgi:NADPH:quinone reductase-like Zn-dependent oxidoreductase